jgi:hypothetical protein
VTLTIDPDGSVTGSVGDARLTRARLSRKLVWIGRARPERTTHIIKAELQGALVAAEQITRRRVYIHLRRDGELLRGAWATDGRKIGGKQTMVFTATRLCLSKAS